MIIPGCNKIFRLNVVSSMRKSSVHTTIRTVEVFFFLFEMGNTFTRIVWPEVNSCSYLGSREGEWDEVGNFCYLDTYIATSGLVSDKLLPCAHKL